MTALYYKPKFTDGYLIKRTNRVNWDSLDKELYSNQPVHGKKIFRNQSPLGDNVPLPAINSTSVN